MLRILYCLNIGAGNKPVLLENGCATCKVTSFLIYVTQFFVSLLNIMLLGGKQKCEKHPALSLFKKLKETRIEFIRIKNLIILFLMKL